MVLPPGTILQYMFLKERLRNLKPGRFVEIGVGQGNISRILLEAGWSGVGYELNPDCARNARKLNQKFGGAGGYKVYEQDWFKAPVVKKFDMVISSQVLEHMDEKDEKKYFRKAEAALKPSGIIVISVPACPDYWSVDDINAGHYRRYTFRDLETKAKKFRWEILDLSGLTYPLSNWLYPLARFLVSRAEGNKKKLSMSERTLISGNRNVLFKTTYPWFFKIFLNEITLFPFHLLQKVNLRNDKCMILYAEMRKKS